MRERPPDVDDPAILSGVRRAWDVDVKRVEHVPLGFGAHHWAAYGERGPRLFVTLDRLEPKRSAARVEAAYVGAATLRDRGLEFVVAPLLTADGTRTVPFADRALSCTTWLDGTRPDALDVPWTTEALRRLHAVAPPAGLPPWRPLVGADLADTTADLTRRPWGPGPFADRARDAVRDHLADLARWTARYHSLAEVARTRSWVATHGEPDEDNQLLTADARLILDWESLKLAPAELDLRTVVRGGVDPEQIGADAEMLELFDLEWRLDEIDQYAAWFAAPHTGNADDEIAFGGLLHELERP